MDIVIQKSFPISIELILGYLYRGGSPKAAAVEKLSRLDIKTIVNFEREFFEKEVAEIENLSLLIVKVEETEQE